MDGVCKRPHDARSPRPVHTDVQAVLAAGARQCLVIGRGRLQLLFGVQLGDMNQFAVGQLPKAGQALVVGMVIQVVIPFEFLLALTPVIIPGKGAFCKTVESSGIIEGKRLT